MAMTLRFFDHYVQGNDPNDFFKWVVGDEGKKDIVDTQTVYINHSKSGATVLKALIRLVEDAELEKMGYKRVEHMWFPTIDFSRLANDTVKQFKGDSRVFKPIYLSNLSTGKSHAMGVVLDEVAADYMFFDPNEGIARFNGLKYMHEWVTDVTTKEYGPAWSGYFLDTWKH